jgi:hypothetical protein
MNSEQGKQAVETLKNETKPLWSSKTFWANVIAAVVPVLYPPAAAWIAANPELYATMLSTVGVLLRTVSSGSVSVVPEKK